MLSTDWAQNYRDRAAFLRLRAKKSRFLEARTNLLILAASFERLAEAAEQSRPAFRSYRIQDNRQL